MNKEVIALHEIEHEVQTLLRSRLYQDALGMLDRYIASEICPSDLYLRKGKIFEQVARDTQQPSCYQEAIRAYGKAIEWNRHNVTAHMRKSIVLEYIYNRYEDALASITMLLEVNPCYAGACVRKAELLYRMGRFEEVVYWCERENSLHGETVRANYKRGQALRKLGRYAAAIQVFLALQATDEGKLYGLCGMGSLLLEWERYAEAAECFAKASEMDYYHIIHHLHLIEARERAGQYQAALAAVVAALHGCGTYLELYHIADRLLARLGQEGQRAALLPHPDTVRTVRMVDRLFDGEWIDY